MSRPQRQRPPAQLFAYLRYRAAALFAVALFAGFFCFVYLLHGLPFGPVGYALLVSGVTLALAAGRDFARFAENRALLRQSLAQLGAADAVLPDPEHGLQQDAAELVRALEARCRALTFAADQQAHELRWTTGLWAHQIKTPLSAMKLLLAGRQGEPFELLQEQLFSVERYVELMLQLQRLGCIGSDLDFGHFPLEQLARQAVRTYAPAFIRSGLALELQPLPPQVLTDEKWAVFIIGQLLSNAVKYTPKGKVTLSLAPGSSATLVIRDTGVGIRPQDLPRLGQQGFTGENGRRDKQATGLGLYLCFQVAEKLGHRLWLESAPGKGTAAYLDLSHCALEQE